jgi:hypothetical protein
MPINVEFQGIQLHAVIAPDDFIAGHGWCTHMLFLTDAGDQCAKQQLLDQRK